MAAERLEVARQGGGAGLQTSHPHNKHPPTPPSSTNFWKIEPRGRCILICLMREQDMFPCSASIKYKRSNIFDNKPSKRNKNRQFQSCQLLSFPLMAWVLTDLREGWFLYFQSFKPLSTIHFDVFCKSQRLSRVKNLKWLTHFRPGVARLSDLHSQERPSILHSAKFLWE